MYRSSNLIESRKCFIETSRNNYLVYSLYDAVVDGDFNTVEYLLSKKNVNPNLILEEYDATALHAATGIGTEALASLLVQVLLHHGADANITTSDKTTPLMISSLWGRSTVSEVLLSYGANPYLEDLDGKSAFDYALDSDHKSAYTLLKEFLNSTIASGLDETLLFTIPFQNQKTDTDIAIKQRTSPKSNTLFSDIESEGHFTEFYTLNAGFVNSLSIDLSHDQNPVTKPPSSICETELFHSVQSENESGKEEGARGSVVMNSSDPSTDRLKQEFKKQCINIGPITKTTKKVYQNLLKKVRNGNQDNQQDEFSTFPEILRISIRQNIKEVISKWAHLERLMSDNFFNCKLVWRGGKEKQFFTYLLLDPFITENLYKRQEEWTDNQIWKTFLLSIFYVGKGKNSRPFSHLNEALKSNFKKTISKKVLRIQNIWGQRSGVICLQIFHNIITAEAHTREAAMIDSLGLNNLTNIQSADYYGVVKNWSIKEKRQLGVVLLYKALQIYLAEGERQIFPSDLSSEVQFY